MFPSEHKANVKHCIERVIADCRFKLLRDMNRTAVEKWAAQREAEAGDGKGMGARTINDYLTSMTAFGN